MTASFWASVSPYLKPDGANKPQGCWEASKRPGCGKGRARVTARPATATSGGECWRHRPPGAVPARAAQGSLQARMRLLDRNLRVSGGAEGLRGGKVMSPPMEGSVEAKAAICRGESSSKTLRTAWHSASAWGAGHRHLLPCAVLTELPQSQSTLPPTCWKGAPVTRLAAMTAWTDSQLTGP